MSTRSSSSNLFSPFSDPESVIRNRRRNLDDPSLLLDFDEINMSNNLNINPGPPLAGLPSQNHNGPPGPNLHMPALDLRTIKELCQPTMNGRGGAIARVNIQATNFGLENHMIQRVQNSCQFHGLPGDDTNKHLDKFLHVTQSMKQNGVTDDALRLYLFPYSLTHHATAWNDISNFRQLPDESLFKAWECYKLLIDRFPNHNMLPVTQIDTFYNELTLRHRDTINAAVGGTFMKRRPEECYDLIENMTAHHNDWDTSTHRGEPSSSTTSSSEIAALAQQMIKMRKDMLQIYRLNQQVNSVTPSCETYGDPHSYYECQAADGYTQDVYATTRNYNSGGNVYQPQGDRNMFSNTIPNLHEEIKAITTRSGNVLVGPSVPPPTPSSSFEEVERDPETIIDHVLTESTTRVPPSVVQSSPSSRPSEIPPPPTSSSFELSKWNPHQP
ncbi:hypothetical protein Tco_0542060 [Tanacetum coccineum]